MLSIKVVAQKKLGLQVFVVYIAGTYATEFLSAAMANTYAMQQAARYAQRIK